MSVFPKNQPCHGSTTIPPVPSSDFTQSAVGHPPNLQRSVEATIPLQGRMNIHRAAVDGATKGPESGVLLPATMSSSNPADHGYGRDTTS